MTLNPLVDLLVTHLDLLKDLDLIPEEEEVEMTIEIDHPEDHLEDHPKEEVIEAAVEEIEVIFSAITVKELVIFLETVLKEEEIII